MTTKLEECVEVMCAAAQGVRQQRMGQVSWAELVERPKGGSDIIAIDREAQATALTALAEHLGTTAEKLVDDELHRQNQEAHLAPIIEEVRKRKAAGEETRPYADFRAEQEIASLRAQLTAERERAEKYAGMYIAARDSRAAYRRNCMDALARLQDARTELTAERERAEKLAKALKPFAEYGACTAHIEDGGWSGNSGRERIQYWFGPSDFIAAAAALAKEEQQ